MEILLRTYLMDGIYNWFIPLESNPIYKRIVDANKKFHQKHIVEVSKKGAKFTVSGVVTVESGVDVKGEQYVDYIYDNSDATKLLQIGVLGKHKKGMQLSYSDKQWAAKVKMSAVENFHLFLLGLDLFNYTKAQLRTAIYDDINRKAGKITVDNIQFIDSHSLVNKIYIESNSWEKAEEVIKKYGLVCIVKFDEIMDAIKLLLGDVTLRLPLCQEADRIHIIPSKSLMKYIEEYN